MDLKFYWLPQSTAFMTQQTDCCHPVLPRGRNFGRKAQKGPKKIVGAGKIWGRIFCRFIKKGPKMGRIFCDLFLH
jgi:hypothetical protein